MFLAVNISFNPLQEKKTDMQSDIQFSRCIFPISQHVLMQILLKLINYGDFTSTILHLKFTLK